MKASAVLTPDRRYRYLLTRTWDEASSTLPIIMLNPSTADAERDDPTIRKCITIAKANKYGGIQVANLFAYRATDPWALRALADVIKDNERQDPVGPLNDAYIVTTGAREGDMPPKILCAWGNHGSWRNRGPTVINKLRRLGATPVCLTVTHAGEPMHPLYAPYPYTLHPFHYEPDPEGGYRAVLDKEHIMARVARGS